MKYFKWVLGHEANVKIVKFDHHGTPIEAFGEKKDALKYFTDGLILYRNFFADMCKGHWKEISESEYNDIKNLFTNPSPPTKYYKWYTLEFLITDTKYYDLELKNLFKSVHTPVIASTSPLNSNLWIEISKSHYDHINYLLQTL